MALQNLFKFFLWTTASFHACLIQFLFEPSYSKKKDKKRVIFCIQLFFILFKGVVVILKV